jgi:hypothetical protein
MHARVDRFSWVIGQSDEIPAAALLEQADVKSTFTKSGFPCVFVQTAWPGAGAGRAFARASSFPSSSSSASSSSTASSVAAATSISFPSDVATPATFDMRIKAAPGAPAFKFSDSDKKVVFPNGPVQLRSAQKVGMFEAQEVRGDDIQQE